MGSCPLNYSRADNEITDDMMRLNAFKDRAGGWQRSRRAISCHSRTSQTFKDEEEISLYEIIKSFNDPMP
jgi:hypothetical protein